MAINHVDITVILPVTIPKGPALTTFAWHRGRLRRPFEMQEAPVEWHADDARLTSWLAADSGRRWYRRPGYGGDEGEADLGKALRNLLDREWDTTMSAYRGEEVTLGPHHTVALDGIDVFRLHDGAERNAMAAIRMLLFLPTHTPDTDDDKLVLLREVLADFA